MNRMITRKLRTCKRTKRCHKNNINEDNLFNMKDDMLNVVYKMLVIHLGFLQISLLGKLETRLKFLRFENLTLKVSY